ncbi:hypothetical protein, partial [Nocardia cyriacigeorgica]|uniref:hypothetical protein n=1 Tax=Nocardia cyriacigeorgica TaxID=135487 RepID=UPI002456FC66
AGDRVDSLGVYKPRSVGLEDAQVADSPNQREVIEANQDSDKSPPNRDAAGGAEQTQPQAAQIKQSYGCC